MFRKSSRPYLFLCGSDNVTKEDIAALESPFAVTMLENMNCGSARYAIPLLVLEKGISIDADYYVSHVVD